MRGWAANWRIQESRPISEKIQWLTISLPYKWYRIDDINKHCLKEFRRHWACLEDNNQQMYDCRWPEQVLSHCIFQNLVRSELFSSFPTLCSPPSFPFPPPLPPSLLPFSLSYYILLHHHHTSFTITQTPPPPPPITTPLYLHIRQFSSFPLLTYSPRTSKKKSPERLQTKSPYIYDPNKFSPTVE